MRGGAGGGGRPASRLDAARGARRHGAAPIRRVRRGAGPRTVVPLCRVPARGRLVEGWLSVEADRRGTAHEDRELYVPADESAASPARWRPDSAATASSACWSLSRRGGCAASARPAPRVTPSPVGWPGPRAALSFGVFGLPEALVVAGPASWRVCRVDRHHRVGRRARGGLPPAAGSRLRRYAPVAQLEPSSTLREMRARSPSRAPA